MKLQKSLILLVALVLMVTSPLIVQGSQYANYSEYDYNRLMQKASEDGTVRVIVEMDVPCIQALTAFSVSFKTGRKGQALVNHAIDADDQLDAAISETRNNILLRLNGTRYHVNHAYSTIPHVALSVSREALEELMATPEVLNIREDRLIPAPKIDEFQETEGDINEIKLQDSTQIVGADVAWNIGYDGSGWYVAVLDTGIRNTHEMFQGKDIHEHCFSSGGYNLIDNPNQGGCPNGLTEMSGPGSAAPYDGRFGHGTHVAGIATGNDFSSHYGVARGASVMAIQVFSYFPSYDDMYSWSSDQLSGMEYVYSMRNSYKIASINMSLGSDDGYNDYCPDSYLANIVQNLRDAGIATLIAAGNERRCGSVGSPACSPAAIAVSGTDKSDKPYTSGNWHDEMVALLAPGVYITSATAAGDNSYSAYSGTSMSTPHVAGAWAIMKQFDESMSIDDILDTLKDTGTMVNSRCEGLLPKPRLDVGEGLLTLFNVAPPINLSVTQEANKAFLSTEYLNVLTWESNPRNQNKDVVSYKIYLNNDGQMTQIAEVGSSTYSYWHRSQNLRASQTYSVTAIDSDGVESPPISFTLEFGITQ